MPPFAALRVLLAFGIVLATSGAGKGSWRPADVRPTTASLDAVLALYRPHLPHDTPVEWSERWSARRNDHPSIVEVLWRGVDFRMRYSIGGVTFEHGRRNGVSWSNDGNGFVRILADPQEIDPLESADARSYGLSGATATVAGESSDGGAYVVQLSRTGHAPVWLYIDKSRGVMSKAVTRIGERSIETLFDDIRPSLGGLRAFHMHTTDGIAEHETDVRVESITPRPVSVADVAIPAARPPLLTFPARTETAVLPARFASDWIVVRVGINGRMCDVLLDSGTSGLFLDSGLADAMHIAPAPGVAVVDRFAVGDASAANVVFRTFPLAANLGSSTEIVGILGHDFFRGNVVHADYEHGRLELIPPNRFTPPPDAVKLPALTHEGIALTTVFVGTAMGSRFLLDTGSQHIVILRRFAEGHATEVKDLGLGSWVERRIGYRFASYVSGVFRTHPAEVRSFVVGPANFRNFVLRVEDASGGPDTSGLDGIVGTDFLRFFDVYFDYDRDFVYLQPNATLRKRGTPVRPGS